MKKTIDEQCFIDCEDIEENSARYCFNSHVLKQGKVNMSQKQIKHIGFIIATDLKNFAESNGNFSNLTANEVYTNLLDNQ